MLFWTVIFFTMNLILLIKNPFKETSIKIGELTIQKAKNEINEKEYNKKLLNIGCFGFMLIPLVLGQFIYFICAIDNDPFIYPTIIVLIYFILNLILNKNTNNLNLDTEEKIVKYREKLYKSRGLKGILTNFIYCCYFGYMFYYLVF